MTRLILFRIACVLLSVATLGAHPQAVDQGQSLLLDNGILQIEFAKSDGVMLAARNLVKGLSLFPEGPGGCRLPQLRITGAPQQPISAFHYEILRADANGQSLRLVWEFGPELTLRVRVNLPPGRPMAYFWPELLNRGSLSVQSLTYPDIPAMNKMGAKAADDVLVHSFVRGTKVLDPAHSLDIEHNPILMTSYPQAYNGMTHQLVDYYSAGGGGFFFAAFDPHATEKLIRMPVGDGKLGISWTYNSWDERPGASLDYDFAFVLGANLTGDWYAAADFYREWAEQTSWCQSAGRWADRGDDARARWLLEDVGLATFGTSASRDMSPWFRAYHDILGAPVFHILGHDDLDQQGRGGDPLDVEFVLHPANRAAFEQTGDPYGVFMADLKTSFLLPEIANEVGRATLSVVQRATPEACPSVPLWRYIHATRASQALQQLGADAVYFDASAANRALTCYSNSHPHVRGRGRWMNACFREMYGETQAAMSSICGEYKPLGVELMHEGLIGRFDYYQARNGGGFMGGLEGGFYRGLQLRGLLERVPVFSYIYHEYAPVALDGCGKATGKIGDIFYWMAARVALAGGIFELNNEFAPTERFAGMDQVGILHYRDGHPFDWVAQGQLGNDAYDPQKGRFLREIAAARTTYGKDFLAYGRMQKPLDVGGGSLELEYHYGNNIDWGGEPNSIHFSDKQGQCEVPRVLHQAWEFEGRLGFFFVNLGQEPLTLELDLDLDRYRESGVRLPQNPRLEVHERDSSSPIEFIQGQPLALRLPPRRVLLLEVR